MGVCTRKTSAGIRWALVARVRQEFEALVRTPPPAVLPGLCHHLPLVCHYFRALSASERLVGPQFSCTVDGDGPRGVGGANVTFGTWNIHGIADSDDGEINHKRLELSQWIDACTNRPSLLFVQETWLQADDTLDIDNYTWLGRNRTNISAGSPRGSGGVGLLVHDSIAARTRVISEPSYGGSEGVLWVRIDHASSAKFDIFCAVYLEWGRPSFPVDSAAVFDGILSDWPRHTNGAHAAFLLGDLNTRIGLLQETTRNVPARLGENVAPDTKARHLVRCMQAMDLVILNGRLSPHVPTFEHKGNRQTSVIDYVAVSGDQFGLVDQCRVIQPDGFDSDHACVLVTLRYSYDTNAGAPQSGRRQYRFRVSRLRDPETAATFATATRARLVDWCKAHMGKQVTCRDDIDSLWNEWRDAITDVATQTIGKTRVRPCKSSAREPWWSPELTRLLHEKQTTLRRYNKVCHEHSGHRTHAAIVNAKTVCDEAKNALKHACKIARRRFQDERLATTEAKMHSDPRGFADDINQIAGRKRKTTVQSIRKNDGRVTTDTAEILSVFRDNYADIGRDSVPAGADFDLTTRQQKVDSVASIRDGPRPSGPPELNTPITVKEVQHAIKKQKDNACSPLDMITNSMLVHGGAAVAVSLKYLFNKIFTSSLCPTSWQTGVMTMVFKTDDKLDWANYRGITLLSIVGKVFESIVATRLSTYLENAGILPAEQGGFRKHFGCTDHVFILAETIKYRARRGQNTYAGFLDIKKAFPTMHHASMLHALSEAGVVGHMWHVIERMYSCNSSRIILNGQLSEPYDVRSGLREGSVLSPILYLVYINTLVKHLERVVPNDGVCLGARDALRIRALLYADDVVLLAEDSDALRRMLAAAEQHASQYQYAFSVPTYDNAGKMKKKGKSQVVVFGERGLSPHEFDLHGVRLQEVLSYKYLGIHLHQSLGRHTRTRDINPQNYLGVVFLDDDCNELRRILRVEHRDTRDCPDTWIAHTAICDDRGDTPSGGDSEAEYLLTADSGFDKMVLDANTRLGHARFAPAREPIDPWHMHMEYVADRIESRRFLLRKMKCQNGGFSPRVAVNLVRSFVLTIATYGAALWNNTNRTSDPIEDKFSDLYADLLGCLRNTPSAIMRAELGCRSQNHERDICSLMYLRRVIALPASRLTKQVYDCITRDQRRGYLNARPNWATCTVPALLSRYSLPVPRRVPPLLTWKKAVREAVDAADAKVLDPSASKAAHYLSLRNSRGMPFYLLHRRSWFVNYGRSIKTRLRCATSALEIDNGRRSGVLDRNDRLCQCCPLRLVESERHFVLDCPLYSDTRLNLTDAIDELVSHADPFGWLQMSWDERFKFLLGDAPPAGSPNTAVPQWCRIQIHLYWFLAHAYKKRNSFVRDV